MTDQEIDEMSWLWQEPVPAAKLEWLSPMTRAAVSAQVATLLREAISAAVEAERRTWERDIDTPRTAAIAALIEAAESLPDDIGANGTPAERRLIRAGYSLRARGGSNG